MQVLSSRISLTSFEVKVAVRTRVEQGRGVITDGPNCWPPALAGMEHERSVLGSAQPVSQKLPFLHILIASAKGILRGGAPRGAAPLALPLQVPIEIFPLQLRG